jgi:hypothetical protein
MTYKAYENKNLLVPGHIKLTPELDVVLTGVDHYWPPKSETVTSALRDPEDSLRIIRQYLKRRGLDTKYPEAMTCDIDAKDGDQYVWQMAWSHLLSLNVIINPPLPAKCLMDYVRNGINKKGQVIGQSPHIKGKAFDIGGLDSITIVKRLVEDGMIRGYLVERENNCIHIDI